MASGPLPKRVVCPACGAPEGVACRDPITKQPVKGVHKPRQAAANAWYDRASPDGLTPRRRDEMVEALNGFFKGRGEVGRQMAKITTSPDPEATFRAITGTHA